MGQQTIEKMQNTRTSLSFLGSSRSYVSTSCASSTSSVHAQESRDELESYLSIFKAEERRKEGGRRGHKQVAMDWGKLLDGQGEEEEEEEQGREEGEGESDGGAKGDDEVTAMFLKPTRAKQLQPLYRDAEPTSNQGRELDYSTERASGFKLPSQPHTQRHSPRRKFGLNTTLVGSHLDLDLADSMTLTDTTTESGSHDYLIGTDQLSKTLAPISKPVPTKGKELVAASSQNFHKSSEVGDGSKNDCGVTKTPRDSRDAVKTDAEDSASSVEQESSDLSTSLDLSGNFRDDVFSLNQLEAVNTQPGSRYDRDKVASLPCSPHSNSEETLQQHTSDDSFSGVFRPYVIQSLADLDSPMVDRKTGPQSTDEEYSSSTDERRQRPNESDEKSYSFDRRKSDITDTVQHERGRSSKESEALSYEEDFESETVRSGTLTRESRNNFSSFQEGKSEERAPLGSEYESAEEYSEQEQYTVHSQSPDGSQRRAEFQRATAAAKRVDTGSHKSTQSQYGVLF